MIARYENNEPVETIPLPAAVIIGTTSHGVQTLARMQELFPEQDWREYVAPVVAPTEENLREQFKAQRQLLVDNIKVTTVAGNEFDGDEVSQTRMARALVGLADWETMTWVLADNTVIQASPEELREALRLAGRAQEAIWVP